MDDQTWERIVDYFAGTLEPEETREFEEWIAADPGRAAEIASLRRIWEVSGKRPHRYDSRAAWGRITHEMAEPDGRTTHGREAPGNALRRPFGRRTNLLRAAAILICVVGGSALLLQSPFGDRLLDRPVPIEEWANHSTDKGQRLRIVLADGSEVLLGPESRLLSPPRFQRDSREVRLEGAGYFTVHTDAERTFTVRAGRGVTTVLGTRFVVRAYPDEPDVHVAVEEGRVSIRSEDDPSDAVASVLETGDVGVIPALGSATVREVNAERYLAWTEGRLAFDRTPVPEALRDLERWYGVEIRSSDPSLAEKHLTLAVGNEPLASVLAVLAATLDVRYTQDGAVVTFLPVRR